MSDLFVEREHRVAPTELFFDLVFVFAFTQVTTLWLEHESWSGLVHGLLVLAVLWWVWASYSWLTNVTDTDAGLVWAVLVFATAALFAAALAVPGAFGTERYVFGFAFFTVVAAFVGLYALVSKRQPDLLAAVLRMTGTVCQARRSFSSRRSCRPRGGHRSGHSRSSSASSDRYSAGPQDGACTPHTSPNGTGSS